MIDLTPCSGCGTWIPVAGSDLTGLGSRCRRCSDAAELAAIRGAPDASSHLTPDERALA